MQISCVIRQSETHRPFPYIDFGLPFEVINDPFGLREFSSEILASAGHACGTPAIQTHVCPFVVRCKVCHQGALVNCLLTFHSGFAWVTDPLISMFCVAGYLWYVEAHLIVFEWTIGNFLLVWILPE